MAVQTPSPTSPPQAPPPPAPRAPDRRRPGTGAIILGLGLIAAGTLWLLAALGVDVPVGSITPVALVVLGIAVLVAAQRGEDDVVIGFAVFVGVWIAIAAVLSATVDVPLAGAVGDREVAPADVADLEDEYRLFAGTQVVDLRDLVLVEGTTSLDVSTVLGQVRVLVPPDVAVQVDASVAAGQVDVFGETTDGVGVDADEQTEGWDQADTRLDLHLRVGLGEIVVDD